MERQSQREREMVGWLFGRAKGKKGGGRGIWMAREREDW